MTRYEREVFYAKFFIITLIVAAAMFWAGVNVGVNESKEKLKTALAEQK